MPARFYLSMEGEKQGLIEGECRRKGFEGWIECLGYQHEVSSPRDPHTGQATGHRQHHLLTITKEFDAATPMLFQALVTNELIKKVTIKWYRPSTTTGIEEHFFTVALETAFIASVKPWVPNVLDPLFKSYTNMEDVSFVYGTINWTHEIAAKASTDDWLTPAA